MSPSKVILFYGFRPILDPEAIRLWQRDLCERLELKGRILLSVHGINATLGGDQTALEQYVHHTQQYSGFEDIDFKWSEGSGHEFPRLRIRVRDEIVSFGTPGELVVDQHGVVDGGIHLQPAEVNQMVAERGDDVVFFDARNAFEARIGKFRNAVVANVQTSRDFIGQLESGQFDHLKHRPIITYCTGGIRCEVLTAVMKRRGFEEVYQLEGGIVRYGEEFGDAGLWEGSLYLFDSRMHHEFTSEVTVIGVCEQCGDPTSTFANCTNLACRRLLLLCPTCSAYNVNADCLPSHRGRSLLSEPPSTDS